MTNEITNEELARLKEMAQALNGWHWPDRKRDPDTGTHYFGQWIEGEFYELGTIDGSNYTLDYADDIRLLKFFRAMQPSTILALIAKVESLAADAERYQWLRSQHWTDNGLCVTQVSSVKLGALTFSEERLDGVIDAMAKEEA